MLFLSTQDSCSWGSMGRNVSHTRTCTHRCLSSELPWESPPPAQPLAHKKIKTLDIISHKHGFEAPSVTRHVPQSVLAPDSWRGLLEDQNDFTQPPTDRGYPECLVRGGELGAWSTKPPTHPTATTPCPGPTRMGDGPENSPRHRQRNAPGTQRPSPRARARQLARAPVPAEVYEG